LLTLPRSLRISPRSQQQTELDEKLQDVYRKLQQAEADRKESSKETRFKELLEDLKRSFGSDAVKGRISDLCKPSSRKYDTAVSITLGRNIDSIVVDTHATGVQCMNVSSSVWQLFPDGHTR
jgi:structural maintenance of chromosome 1